METEMDQKLVPFDYYYKHYKFMSDIYDLEADLFDESNIPESNWMKFTKVGDSCSGILVDAKDKAGVAPYPSQRVFILKQKDGTTMNVGIAVTKDYTISRANSAKIGDLLGFKFAEEFPVKGKQPAKSITVYVKHIENNDVPFE